jgi:hypothetical protein
VILVNLDGTRAFVNRFGHRALDQLLDGPRAGHADGGQAR